MDHLEEMLASQSQVLLQAKDHALAFLDGLGERRIGPAATVEDLRSRLEAPLPEHLSNPTEVIDRLVRDVDGGLLGSTAGRFFGWVIGGALPVAIAADWLTTTWDQNSASYALSPAEAVIEEVCGAWLKQLLGLPSTASFALVTGCQMAHTTALAAARHKLLQQRGIDVEKSGLHGAPRLRILASLNRHESIMRSVRLLGLGADSVELLPCDEAGTLRMDALLGALRDRETEPTIVCLQAGDLNTGAYDPFEQACALSHSAGAWVHVDGAFGLWAAVSDRFKHFLRGVDQADSWATDGHKWLNLPYDSGFVFVADSDAHSAAFAQSTSYGVLVDGTRRQINWNPEWSRRGRGFAVYATIRTLGRSGIAAIVEHCSDHAAALVDGLAAMPDVEVLARPTINQGLVRFLDRNGRHDARTDAIIDKIQRSGHAWFGGTTWRGMRAMRISVCNWRTTEDDVRLTLDTVRNAIGSTPAAAPE